MNQLEVSDDQIRQDTLARIAELRQFKPNGWQVVAATLCDALAKMEGLPCPKRPLTTASPKPPHEPYIADGLATGEDGHLELQYRAAPNDERAEVLEILRTMPDAALREIFSELGLNGSGETIGMIQRAFAEGRKAGFEDGMRELFAVLFKGSNTTKELGERVLVAAYELACPNAPAESIRELETATGLCHGTTLNRVKDFRATNPGLRKLTGESPDSIGSN
jgi:hypothetical protein